MVIDDAYDADGDGYKAILVLIKRFDPRTTGSMLREYMEVVNPRDQ